MSDQSAEVDTFFQQTVEGVRALTANALAQNDETMMAMLSAIGSIAVGIRDYQTIQNAELRPLASPQTSEQKAESTELAQIKTTEDEIVDEQLELTLPLSSADLPATESNAAIHHSETAVPIAATLATDKQATDHGENSVRSDNPEQTTEGSDYISVVKEYFPALTLNEREAKCLVAISMTGGTKFRTSHVAAAFEAVNPGAASAAYGKLVRKIHNSPYADSLTFTGERAGRRYVWHGVAIDSIQATSNNEGRVESITELKRDEAIEGMAAIAVASAAEDSGISEEKHEVETVSVNELYAAFGISFSENGHKELSVHGAPLKLSDLGAEIVHTIVVNGGMVTYKMLSDALVDKFTEPSLDRHRAKSELSRKLQQSFNEVESALKHFDIAWSDSSTVIDGKKVRRFKLGEDALPPSDTVTSRGNDFLTKGLKKSPIS